MGFKDKYRTAKQKIQNVNTKIDGYVADHKIRQGKNLDRKLAVAKENAGRRAKHEEIQRFNSQHRPKQVQNGGGFGGGFSSGMNLGFNINEPKRKKRKSNNLFEGL